MPFLSRVRFNPTRRDTRRLCGSAQSMHAAVLGSHPDLALGNSSEQRVLWRLDQYSSHDIQLYVVSPTKPDFTGLIEQAGWPSRPEWDTTDYAPFLAALGSDQTWRYRLTANPVRVLPKRPGDPRRRGKVSPHLTVRQQQEWLAKQAQTWGFKVPADDVHGIQVEVRDRRSVSFVRRGPSDSSPGRVPLTQATFTGTLTVTDAVAFRAALTGGMGRAKAYGCGLMTLAPLR